MKKYLPLFRKIIVFSVFFMPVKIYAQCYTAQYGQRPSSTKTITNCNGAFQTIANNCLNGEYSKMNVTAGRLYSFKSSRTTDYITISNNVGTLAYSKGTGTLIWTASFTGVVRFYTHKNATCSSDTKKKQRLASCSIPPCPSPGAAIASGITDTTASISWNASIPSPGNGYQYEIRTSGSGGSGSSGLQSSGITSRFVTSSDIIGLTPGTIYTPFVRSNCGTAYSNYIAGNNFTTTGIAPNPVPPYSHIIVVIGENTNASSVFGNSNAPYINSLAATGAKFTNSFALFHPSQPNYIALYSGSNQGITNDNYISNKFTTANLGRELIDAGKTYITYSEDLPYAGFDGNSSGLYERKHNPAASWMGTGTNQIPATTNQPYSAFPSDYNNLPNVSFVIPNQCNDGHNSCAPLFNYVRQYDLWLQNNLNAYKQWAVNNNSLLIVTYDEDDFTPTNKIATVFAGAYVAQGTYTQTINHYNVLRTIEEANRLTTHAGAAASVARIDYCWTQFPGSRNVDSYYLQNVEKNSVKNILVYPNPAKDKINMMIGNMFNSKNLSWEIYTLAGIKYRSGKTIASDAGNVEISINDFENGIYLIHLSEGNNVGQGRFAIVR